jgi:CO/xanthine dehydrogenase Mo-binding subunit
MEGSSFSGLLTRVEIGHFRIANMINVADVGRAINPHIVETQLSGAAIMQLGFTTTEKMEFEAGQVTNASLADYKIPGLLDLPDVITSAVIDANQQNGPFGAKGVGESGTFGVSPAIANAIQDAIGVRITSLPITPEKVYRAIRAARNDPLED